MSRIDQILNKKTGFSERVKDNLDTRYNEKDWLKAQKYQSKYKFSGINYSHFGSRGSGLVSMAESNAVAENMQRNTLGSIATTLNKSGGGTMNYKGKLYQTDENGNFVIVDGEKLKKKKSIRNEHNQYVYEIVKNICDCEEDICEVLGYDDFDTMETLLSSRGDGGVDKMPQVLKDADATPEAMRSYPEESKELRLGIAKLMYIAGQKDNIIWEDSTGTNEADEKNRSY